MGWRARSAQLVWTSCALFGAACLLLLVLLSPVGAQPDIKTISTPPPAGVGFIEEAHMLDTHTLRLKGWAASTDPSVFVTMAHVWLDQERIYVGRIGYATSRIDVAEAYDWALWQSSGFEMHVRIPSRISAGPATIRMEVFNGDGSRFELQALPAAQRVEIQHSANPPSWRALALLGLAIALPILALLTPERRQAPAHADAVPTHPPSPASRRHWRARRSQFAAAMLLSFGMLVTGGWTGSSLRLLLDHTPMLTHDAGPLFGQAQLVRSDEWLVVTPLAISQRSQPQPFSSINSLHGLHGQNMNAVGMTGVPVANLAVLAKPAVWGFFLFDLRRALAWDWWLPFFACFGALWLVLQHWFHTPWRWAAVLAAAFSLSPYSVSFSGWPAYVTCFPLIAILALDRLLQLRSPGGRSVLAGAGYGLLAGLAVASFALVLYPGWQIALVYLIAPLALAYFWQTRQQRALGMAQWLGLLAAVAMTLLIMGSWWLDAREAIQTMQATVYPGKRSTEVGGYADPWALSKGLTNITTMFQSSMWSIPSDAGSFVFVLLPLAVATAMIGLSKAKGGTSNPLGPVVWVLWAYTAFVVLFMLVGLPARLSELSLWGRVPAIRLDVALGLAQTFLLAWLLGRQYIGRRTHPNQADESLGLVAILTGLTSAGLALWQHTLMPAPLQDWVTSGTVAFSVGLIGLLGALLVSRQHLTIGVALYGIWMLAAALPFNPLGQAPTRIAVTPALATLLKTEQPAQRPRVAVIWENRWANALSAAGASVLNTTFYNPPLAFWEQLDPSGHYTTQYNRYQHLGIFLAPERQDINQGDPTFTIAAPALDRVELRIDAQRFDFERLSADYVLANRVDAGKLQSNPSLTIAHTEDDWTLFSVIAAHQHP